MAYSPAIKATVIAGMLVFGTCTVVIQKIIFSLKGEGRYGKHHYFDKPWFQTEVMFVGMLGCLAVFEGMNLFRAMQSRNHPERAALLDKSVNGGSTKQGPSRAKQYIVVIAPAMCDLVATAMMNIGLLWIPASVWQMLRGSMVIFSAVFSKFFLKRELHASHWVGVGCVTFALLVVAFSSLMKPCDCSDPVSSSSSGDGEEEAGTGKEIIGTFLVVFAQIIQASQIVVEEFLLAEVSLPPTLIVGLEGLWGGLAGALVLIVVHNIHVKNVGEDSIDTFIMLGKNPGILCGAILYAIAILCYNMFGMYVTQVSSAVIRTILEGLRTACIWVVNLFIHYVVAPNNKKLGEKWTEWSYLQFCGFLFLLLGMLVYNSIVRIDGLYYAPPKVVEPPKEEQQ